MSAKTTDRVTKNSGKMGTATSSNSMGCQQQYSTAHYVHIMPGAAHNNKNLRGLHSYFRNPYGFFVFFRCSVEDKSFCFGPHLPAETQKTGKKS